MRKKQPQTLDSSGYPCYFVVKKDGQVHAGSGWTAYAASASATAKVSLARIGASPVLAGTFPAGLPRDSYELLYFRELTPGTPNIETDLIIDSDDDFYFDGTDGLTNTEAVESLVSLRHGAGMWGDNTGHGANIYLVTLNDGQGRPVAGASVRMSSGLYQYQGTTDVNGAVAFGVESDTYTVAATKAGYAMTPATITISADDADVYSLTPIVVSPAAQPGQTTAYLYFYKPDGTPDGGQKLSYRMIAPPNANAGIGHDLSILTSVASGSTTGLVQITLMAGATYAAWNRRGQKELFVAGPGPVTAIPQILGKATAE